MEPHDPECESELTSHGYTPCRCEEPERVRKFALDRHFRLRGNAVAENVWEEIGGICICQQSDVSHWCESCQHKIAVIARAINARVAIEVFRRTALLDYARHVAGLSVFDTFNAGEIELIQRARTLIGEPEF
jgi:hypothetical protein